MSAESLNLDCKQWYIEIEKFNFHRRNLATRYFTNDENRNKLLSKRKEKQFSFWSGIVKYVLKAN